MKAFTSPTNVASLALLWKLQTPIQTATCASAFHASLCISSLSIAKRIFPHNAESYYLNPENSLLKVVRGPLPDLPEPCLTFLTYKCQISVCSSLSLLNLLPNFCASQSRLC